MDFQIEDCLNAQDYISRGVRIKSDAYSIFLYYVGDFARDKETSSIDPNKITCTCTPLQAVLC